MHLHGGVHGHVGNQTSPVLISFQRVVRRGKCQVTDVVGFGGFTFGASWFDSDDGPAEILFESADIENADIENADIENADIEDIDTVMFNSSLDIMDLTGCPTDNINCFSYSEEQDGWGIAGKYDIGNLTLAATYNSLERDQYRGSLVTDVTVEGSAADGYEVSVAGISSVEETALVLGASYAIGGGLTAWIEYLDIDQEVKTPRVNATATVNSTTLTINGVDDPKTVPTKNDDSLIMVGLTLGF